MTPDVLEQRLADLVIDTPDPGRVTARVMSHAAKPTEHHAGRIVAIGVATVAFMGAVLYFAPAVDVVLADAQIAHDLLRDAGLVGAGDRVTAVGAASTSSGYRLELVGAYADSARTVMLIHAEPAIWLAPGPLELTDQFGRVYQMHGGRGDAITGNLILQFDALAWPDAITGARITLHMTAVQPVTCTDPASVDPAAVKCNMGTPVAGSWTLSAILGVDKGSVLATPASAQLGPASFRFTSVRASAASIVVDIVVTGVTSEELSRRIPDGKKGQAVFTIQLLGPHGEIVGGGGWGGASNEQGVQMHLLGYRITPGEYHVHATYLGHGEFDRVIRVP